MYSKVDKIIKINNQLSSYGINSNINDIKYLSSRLSANEYVVAVIGPMKSGKSTLINALIGYDLMPNENEACTLTTTDIINMEKDDKVSKVFANKKIEHIEGENINKLFHEDVRKSRSLSSPVDFFYKVNSPIHILKNMCSNIKFKLVDTPGYNENEGLGVKKDKINKTFEGVLKRAHSIIYVFDYQYYKSDENIEILKKMKDMRPDILENDMITFVLNKVDLIGYKDEEIEVIINKVGKMLGELGIKYKVIYPLIAKKALLGRMVENNQCLSEMKKDLDSYIPIVAKDIDGKTFKVKEDINNIFKELIDKSCIERFEEEVIKFTFNNIKNNIEKSANNIINTTLKDMHEEIQDEKVELIEKQKIEDEKMIVLKGKIKRLNISLRETLKIQSEIDQMLEVPNYEDIRQKDYFEFFISNFNNYPDDYDYKYSSSYQAEKEGKEAFRRWKSGIENNFEIMYNVYSSKLQYSCSEDNYFYKINKDISKKLKSLNSLVHEILKQINSPQMISIVSDVNIMPDILKLMTYENTKEYISDIYDNSDFVNWDDTEEYLGEGLFGKSRYKTKYCYDTSKARYEEEKDHIKGGNRSSEIFFNDYYEKKYNIYLKSIKDVADYELAKVDSILNKINKELRLKLDKLIKNKEINLDNKLIEICNIEEKIKNIKEEIRYDC